MKINVLKNSPSVIGVVVAFMFGFSLATMLYKMGVNPPPEPFTESIAQYMYRFPLLFIIILCIVLFSMLFFVIWQLKTWILGFIKVRRAWGRNKRRKLFKKFGYIPNSGKLSS